MMSRRTLAGAVLLSVLAAVPAFADDGRQGRSRGERRGDRTEERRGREGSRAVPRAPHARRSYDRPRHYGAREHHARRYDQARRYDYDRRTHQPRRYDYDRRTHQRPYAYSNRGYAGRGYIDRGHRGYVDRGYYGRRTVIVPRYVHPRVVRIVPYRPYFYRPSIAFGIYYGAGGSYPYGYTPRGYYDPIPGRIYGGVRITDAPRDAQVFADGYYVGIVDDFDGVFQHVNLEAGEHRIEIRSPGFDPITFDIVVQPGRTTTLRADAY
jgi:hypothetical protein